MWQVITFPPVETSEGQEGNGSTHSMQYCPPVDVVLVARLFLSHPYDTGNYNVREESESVPMLLMENSDECVDRADDHRNVWIILKHHAGSVLHKEGISLVS